MDSTTMMEEDWVVAATMKEDIKITIETTTKKRPRKLSIQTIKMAITSIINTI